MTINKLSSQKGFTLLEAIVAMVIVSILSMSLYSWLNVSYVSSGRAIKTLSTSDVVVSAKSYIEMINPMAEPEGVRQLGDYYVKWRSSPVTETLPARNGASLGAFDVALYNVEVDLFSGEIGSTSELVGSYSVELIGYKYERAPAL